jgi:protein gp37
MIWWTKRWNPITGCTKCSPACDNCYAERLHTQRHKALLTGKHMPECYAEPFDHVRFLPERLVDPLHWRKPQRVFPCNMSDIFHAEIDDRRRDLMFGAMAMATQHVFTPLTKRWERMAEYMGGADIIERIARACGQRWGDDAYHHIAALSWPLPNVWLGATIWDQASADRAVPILLSTPAAKRFVSVEPMLGPVDVAPYLPGSYECALTCGHREGASSRPEVRCLECGFQGLDTYEVWGDGNTEICPKCGNVDAPEPVCPECGTGMVQEHPDTQYLDWVICGGETGANARPMHPDWPRSLRDQCQDAGVPFFFKQWGEWAPGEEDGKHDHINITTSGADWDKLPMEELSREMIRAKSMLRVGNRRAGRVLDGRTWEEVPNA